jgi:hypothetical protein
LKQISSSSAHWLGIGLSSSIPHSVLQLLIFDDGNATFAPLAGIEILPAASPSSEEDGLHRRRDRPPARSGDQGYRSEIRLVNWGRRGGAAALSRDLSGSAPKNLKYTGK